MRILYALLEALAMVFALSADALVTGFAYGAKKIAIPLTSTLLISRFAVSGRLGRRAAAPERDRRRLLCPARRTGRCQNI